MSQRTTWHVFSTAYRGQPFSPSFSSSLKTTSRNRWISSSTTLLVKFLTVEWLFLLVLCPQSLQQQQVGYRGLSYRTTIKLQGQGFPYEERLVIPHSRTRRKWMEIELAQWVWVVYRKIINTSCVCFSCRAGHDATKLTQRVFIIYGKLRRRKEEEKTPTLLCELFITRFWNQNRVFPIPVMRRLWQLVVTKTLFLLTSFYTLI